MTETTAVATQTRRQPLRAGANALGIVPQTIEDVWKIARYVCMGKMAPDGLTRDRDADEQASAVSTIILSGLELGLSPMVSLRSFGMINNKPGLYGDGLINVCRRHSTAEYVKLGFIRGADEEYGDDAIGWCEAKRSDTGEVSREEFSVADAKRANLWQTEATVEKEVWEGPKGNRRKTGTKKVPNDATWYRYPKRMLQWRAAGYCLRNLFADVLGGVPTMDELQEVFGEEEMRDVTPTQITRSSPPPPPDEEEVEEFDAAAFGQKIEKLIADAADEETLIASWETERVDELLADHTDWLDSLYDQRVARIKMFDGDVTDEDEGDEQADEPSLPLGDEPFPGDKKAEG